MDEIGYQINGAAFEVHKQLGGFLYENTYEKAFAVELQLRGLKVETQHPIPERYKGVQINDSIKADLLVEDKIPIELKAVIRMSGIHLSQLMSYLRFGGFEYGYLINFWAEDFRTAMVPEDLVMDKGIYRIINRFRLSGILKP